MVTRDAGSDWVPCEARWQEPLEEDATVGAAVWRGATEDWAAANIGSLGWISRQGRESRANAAVMNALREGAAPS
eukprot:SAG22_NODE_18041_length_294_cov_0.800000_1_plen_74_part_10